MKSHLSKLLAAVAFVGSLAGSGSALAQGTWDFGGASCNPGGAPSTATCTVGSVTATISAWGFTTGGTGFVQGNLGEFDPNGFGAYTGKFETGTGSQHAFDNLTTGCGTTTLTGNSGLSAGNSGCGGNIEAMLINFGTARVNLSQIKQNYSLTDADLSVYRWDGAGAGTVTSTTAAAIGTSTALSGSWTLISSGDMDGTGGTNPFNTGNTGYSSTFLITTYFGASVTSGSLSLDHGNDAFKIQLITASACTGTLSGANNGATCTPSGGGSTPEPSSLALIGLAVLGAGAARRRIARQA